MAVFNNQLAIFFKIQQSLSVSRHKLALGHHYFTLNFQQSSPRYGRWLFPKGSAGKECRRHSRLGFDPRVGKVPWRKAWQPPPVFLARELPWTEEPGGLPSMGLQRVRHNWETKHSSSIIFLPKSFVSVTIMIPFIKPRFHGESLQLFLIA